MKLKTITHKEFDDYTNKVEENVGIPLETVSVAGLEDCVLLMIEREISNKKSAVPVFIQVDNDIYCLESYTKTEINGRECIMLNTYSDTKLYKK